MEIETFTDNQMDDVAALWTRCGLLQPTDGIERIIRLKTDFQPNLFLIGTLDGKVAATVMAGYEGHRGWINLLAVDPDHQRAGLGRAIMRDAERRLLALGCPKVNLQVRAGNEAVVRFYEKLGYAVEDRVSMGKRMTGEADM